MREMSSMSPEIQFSRIWRPVKHLEFIGFSCISRQPNYPSFCSYIIFQEQSFFVFCFVFIFVFVLLKPEKYLLYLKVNWERKYLLNVMESSSERKVFSCSLHYLHHQSHNRLWSSSRYPIEHLTSSYQLSQLCINTWVKSWTDIHSCVAYFGQVYLAEPMHLQVIAQPMSSNLKTRLGHGHWFYRRGNSALIIDFWLGNPPSCDAVSSTSWIH